MPGIDCDRDSGDQGRFFPEHILYENIKKYSAAGRKLGGTEINQGDMGFEFTVLQDYRIRISVWEADEEFPPSAQIMFSDNFAAGFLAEESVVAAELLIGALSAAMG